MCSRSWFSWGTPVQTVVSNDNIDVESFIKNQVDEVNEYRKTHGVDPLTLDENLSQYSQEWANHLASTGNFSHRGNSPYGENLASGYPLSSLNPAHMWYSEVNNINYNNLEGNCSCFHFTQLVWKNSKKLGIGVATSPSNGMSYVVANFEPRGNIMGSFRSNVFPPSGGR